MSCLTACCSWAPPRLALSDRAAIPAASARQFHLLGRLFQAQFLDEPTVLALVLYQLANLQQTVIKKTWIYPLIHSGNVAGAGRVPVALMPEVRCGDDDCDSIPGGYRL